MENEIMYIKLDDIIPNRFQPREVFDEDALNKLADSIKQHGVIEPILVRPVSNKYEIVAGERRYKASVLAGLTKIPAMVKQLDDKQSSIIAFIENEHRSGVSAIEEARTMERIMENNKMTQEELAKELGINQSTIANKIRLLNLPLRIQEALMHNEISERHARSLLSVKDENKQLDLLNKIKEKKMTVRELDSEIKNMNEYTNNFNNISNNYMNNPLPQNGYNNQMANNYNNQMPQSSQNNEPVDNNSFMNYLNDYNTNPVPQNGSSLMEQTTGNDDFMNYLNNYDNNNPLPQTNPVLENQNNNVNMNYPNNNFMSQNSPTNQSTGNDDFMNYLNNYDNNNPISQNGSSPTNQSTGNDDFMNYLNNYDNNNPIPQNGPSPMNQPTGNDDFMNYLNNYDNNNPIPQNGPSPMDQSTGNDDFMNYLNNYDNNNPLPQSGPVVEEQNNNGYMNYPNNNSTSDNVMINNVTPPITSNFNQYVENNENFVDVSKQNRITSIDEIINKLKTVVSEIKEESIYKVDTEEINYDDIYQINIKIDKRDY